MASILEVDTIAHSGGTSAMTIDSTGRILTPARPSFFVKGNGGWIDHGSSVVTYFKTSTQAVEIISNVGSHYDASTGKFTVPVTGLYQFNVSLYVNDSGDPTTYSIIYVDGSHVHNNWYNYSNADTAYPDNSLEYSICIELNATQEVEIKVVQDIYGNHSNWSGYLVG